MVCTREGGERSQRAVLVTGGAGFVGSHVVDALVAAGNRVVVVDNLATGSRHNLNPVAAFCELDIRSETLADAFAREHPQAVYHLAAQMDVRHSIEDPIHDADTNILGSIRVLECCVAHGVKKIVFVSSAGAVYGEPAELPATEDSPCNPMSHYGASKYAVEQYVKLYSRLYGLNYTILRLANVYGPRQNPNGEAGVCAILIGLMLAGKPATIYGYGKPVRDYVYVGDVARAALLALERGDGETLNIGSGTGTTVLEIFAMVQDLTGYNQEPAMEPLRRGEVNQIYTDCARSTKSLGWRPEVTFREGLARTIDHIRAHAV